MLFAPRPWTLARTWLAVMMLALLALLAACGGTGDDDEATAAPTLEITSDAPGTATGAFTLTFTFSAAVSDFATNRILISGAFLNGTSLSRVSDTVYTLVLTPTPNLQAAAEITVPAGGFKDAGGDVASARAYGFSQAYDTVVVGNEPLLTLTNDVTGGVATAAITFTLNFSTDVDLDVGQFGVSGGTLTSYTRQTGTRYTLVVTPPALTTGFVLLQLPAGAFSSTAGVPSAQDYSMAVFYATP